MSSKYRLSFAGSNSYRATPVNTLEEAENLVLREGNARYEAYCGDNQTNELAALSIKDGTGWFRATV